MATRALPRAARLGLLLLVVAGAAVGYLLLQGPAGRGARLARFLAWSRDPEAHPDWTGRAGVLCADAPFQIPTDGYIGFLWGDSFRPGHRHQGVDIFGGAEPGQTPVYAAAAGFLTREPEWRSAVIIRIPDDPLDPGRQIWTYYTHMADREGNSFIAARFPPGVRELPVAQGDFLGYQGDFSGDPNNPVGVHLHFSIVLDDGQGGYRNELRIQNTLDPSPYLGLALNARTNGGVVPVCR